MRMVSSEQLIQENEKTRQRGIARGWTSMPKQSRTRQILGAVVGAANEAGLGDIDVEDVQIGSEDRGFAPGVTITDYQNSDHSGLWEMMDGVREQVGYGTSPVDGKELDAAVQTVVGEKKAGTLGERVRRFRGR